MNFRTSITTRFITILLLILITGQGVGTFLFLKYSRSSLLTTLHERMRRGTRQAAGVTAEPILNYNFPLLDAYLDESLKDRDIAGMQFVDKAGAVIREKAVPRGDRQVYVAQEPITLNGEPIGTVRLRYTTTTIDEAMNRSLLLIPLYQGILLFVVAVVLIRLFQSAVKRPVGQINAVIEQVTSGNLSVRLPQLGKDEIGTIGRGVAFLVERLSGTLARVNSISHNVTAAGVQLNQTFDKVRTVVDNQHKSTGDVSHAVKETVEAQGRIIGNTEQLLSLSSENVSALLQMGATSEEIAANADNLNSNLQNSYSTLTELSRSAKQVALMSGEVSTAVESASASVEEIFRSVKEVETIVRESAKLSERTTDIVSGQGIASIRDATESMRSIDSFIASLMAAIERLSVRSKDIEKMLSVIETVTEQTRLLSLNAQIIAAQAGASGKGFAVVADEMKELSDRTAVSTREIDSIVSEIRSEIDAVVTGMNDTVIVVSDGNEVVKKTAAVLADIQKSSQQASELAKSIERASSEQTRGLELVVSATEQIRDKIHEVNRATTEQEKSTSYLLENISPIKETMEVTRRATEEQAGSTRLITRNIELANQRTAEIAHSSNEQQSLNERIIAAIERVMHSGSETVTEVSGISPFISSLLEEVEALKREMEVFRISAGEAPMAAAVASGGIMEIQPAAGAA